MFLGRQHHLFDEVTREGLLQGVTGCECLEHQLVPVIWGGCVKVCEQQQSIDTGVNQPNVMGFVSIMIG
jgi:hypothetical protein